MQMVRICACHAYADVRHMDMFSICIFFSFPAQIRKKAVPDLPEPHRRAAAHKHNMCHSVSGVYHVCCAPPQPCDPARRAGKDRFASFLLVLHFRKVVNR